MTTIFSDEKTSPREIMYAATTTWGEDAYVSMRRSRRRAWAATVVAAFIALIEAFALLLMAPLKTVVPYTILVDRQTGYVQAVDPLAPIRISADSALTRSFLAQYVTARESYDAATLQTDYRKVALWSEGSARSRYIASMQSDDPSGPIARFGRNITVNALLRSVSPLGSSSALIRFDTVATEANGTTRKTGSWAAVVRFRYRDVPLPSADRLINPLGFTVTSYRRDPETLPTTSNTDASR